MQQHQVAVAPGGGEGGAAGDHLQQDEHQGVGGKTRDGVQLVGLDVQDREQRGSPCKNRSAAADIRKPHGGSYIDVCGPLIKMMRRYGRAGT